MNWIDSQVYVSFNLNMQPLGVRFIFPSNWKLNRHTQKKPEKKQTDKHFPQHFALFIPRDFLRCVAFSKCKLRLLICAFWQFIFF